MDLRSFDVRLARRQQWLFDSLTTSMPAWAGGNLTSAAGHGLAGRQITCF